MLEVNKEEFTAEAPQEQEAEGAKQDGEAAPASASGGGKGLDAILGVRLEVRVVLGRNRLPISELLNLTKGSVIELDRRIGEPVELMINDRMVARGDLVRVQGDTLGVALREIVKDFVSDI